MCTISNLKLTLNIELKIWASVYDKIRVDYSNEYVKFEFKYRVSMYAILNVYDLSVTRKFHDIMYFDIAIEVTYFTISIAVG